jgi:hypothetical protein
MYTYREDGLAGGLISYATNYYDVFRRAAISRSSVSGAIATWIAFLQMVLAARQSSHDYCRYRD